MYSFISKVFKIEIGSDLPSASSTPWGWARSKSEAKSLVEVSQANGDDPAIWIITSWLPGVNAELEAELGLQPGHSNLGFKCCKWHLNLHANPSLQMQHLVHVWVSVLRFAPTAYNPIKVGFFTFRVLTISPFSSRRGCSWVLTGQENSPVLSANFTVRCDTWNINTTQRSD